MSQQDATDNPTDGTSSDRSDPMTKDNVTEDIPEIPDDVPRPDPNKDQG